jgi:hypothetical protein
VEETLKELEEAKDDPTLKIVKKCPVSFLREVRDDGTDIFIGSLATTTCLHGELMGPDGVDWENKKKREDENNSLKAGDPRMVWTFGGKQWSTCCQYTRHMIFIRFITRLLGGKSSSPRDYDRCSRHRAPRLGHSSHECPPYIGFCVRRQRGQR